MIVDAGPIEEKLKTQAAQLGLLNIHFLGVLPAEDKVALLTLCCAVLFFVSLAFGGVWHITAGRCDIWQTDDFQRDWYGYDLRQYW